MRSHLPLILIALALALPASARPTSAQGTTPPELTEQEGNDSRERANVLMLPGTVVGQSGFDGDVDFFSFNGMAGQTVVFEVESEIYQSGIDPVLGLTNNTGGKLFTNDDERPGTVDPKFNIVLPYTGTYYITVRDIFERGSASKYYYSLTITPQDGTGAPHVTTIKTAASGSDKLMKKVNGSAFTRTGMVVEINGISISGVSANAKKPTSVLNVKPPISVFKDDVITVVGADGRRSNPLIVP